MHLSHQTEVSNPLAPSLQLLRECRVEAFTDAAVDELARIVGSITRTPLPDRALSALVVKHRVVRSKLERHRQLVGGAL
jgi:hypothetical protein